MDNAQKAIMLGVGLFITIIVIAAVMTITGIGQDLLNQGQSNLSNLSGQLQTQLMSQYDQKKMSGSLVLSAVKNFYTDTDKVIILYNTIGKTDNPIYVTQNKFGTGVNLTINGTGSATSAITVSDTALDTTYTQLPLANFSDATNNSDYIKPTAQYKSVLVQTGNGGTLGVAFIRYQ